MSNNLGLDLFPDPVGHYGLSRQLGVVVGAGLESVSAPWYSKIFHLIDNIILFVNYNLQTPNIGRGEIPFQSSIIVLKWGALRT